MDCISEVLFTGLMLLERPPDSFQILKDLLTLSSILIGNFDCQISDFVRIILPVARVPSSYQVLDTGCNGPITGIVPAIVRI